MVWDSKEQQELAKVVHQNLTDFARKNPHMRISKESLMYLGQAIWSISYKQSDDDEGAAYALLMSVNQAAVQGDPMFVGISQELLLPQSQIAYSGAALWYHQGLPQVVMGHKYAAALLATKLSKDVVASIRPPWRAFFIEVPKGLLLARDNQRGEDVSITGILVAQLSHKDGGKRWVYYAISESQVTLWAHGVTSEHLVKGDTSANYENDLFIADIQDIDLRTASLIGRLILNVCLAMSDPTNVKPPKETKSSKKAHNERTSNEPKARTYILGSTPSVDCRQHVAEYVRTGRVGTSTQLSVQLMVAGHWKNQAHGPELSLRKLLWIEPYWKGPEEAPVIVKPHALREDR